MIDHRSAAISDDEARQIFRWMLLARRLDERFSLLQRSGAIPLAVSCRGHEAAQVGAALAFRPGQDWWFPYYRDLAAVLVAGSSPLDLMLASFGRAADPASGGRQTPYNWGNRALNIVARSAPVGVQVPQAAGVGLAAQRRGDPVAVYCSLGEGAAAQGEVHEGMNYAAIYRAPVLFFVQQNGWAISVPAAKQMACEQLADRAAGYGIPGVTVDGSDPFAVLAAAREAVARARAGDGPTLLVALVARIDGHTCDDNQRLYRAPDELAAAAASDPLPKLRAYLSEAGLLTAEDEAALEARIAQGLDQAEAEARAAP